MSVDETVSSVMKRELLGKILVKLQAITEQVDQNAPRLDFLVGEIVKVDYPLHVFNNLKKLWIGVEHKPIFSHGIDEKLEFIELEFSYRNLQLKQDSFNQSAREFLEIQNRFINELPSYINLESLELEPMKALLLKLENDQREYLEWEFGKLVEKWEDEKLYEKSVELVQRMESMMAVVTQKLRDIALSQPILNVRSLEKDFALLQPNEDELASVLRDEVRLVRGSKRKHRRKTNQNDIDTSWREAGDQLADNGGDDFTTKVIKMKCSVVNGRVTQGRDNFGANTDYQQLKSESIRLFKGICVQAGIQLLPEDINVKVSPPNIGRQRARGSDRIGSSGGARHSRDKKASSATRKSNPNKSVDGGRSSGVVTFSSSGGGKRPPDHPNSSSSNSDDDPWLWTETEESGNTTTSTPITDSARPSQIPLTVESHLTHEIKEIIKGSHKGFDIKGIHSDPSHPTTPIPYEGITKRFKSAISMPESISVQTYKASGKVDKAIKVDKKISLPKPHLDKLAHHHPVPPPILRAHEESRKSARAEKKILLHKHSRFSSGVGITSEAENQNSQVSPLPEEEEDELRRMPQKFAVLYPNFIPKRRRSARPTAPLLQLLQPSIIENLDDLRRMEGYERSDEWLEWTSSEEEYEAEESVSKNQYPHEQDPEKVKEKKDRPIQSELGTFLHSTRVLDKINTIFGLCPYTRVVRSNRSVQFLWIRKSTRYIYLLINSFFYFMTTLFIFLSFIAVLRYDAPLPTYQEIIKIDFSHHFLEALFLTLLNLFLTIWSVSSVFSMGAHYAEFYSRFNLAICLTKYDVSEGISSMILKNLLSIVVFEACVLLLFFGGRSRTGIVRESCGFLGYTLLRQFNLRIRESEYFPFVEILGLFVFLYCFFCFSLVLLELAVYAKALGNMGKRFNLRLAFALGALSPANDDQYLASRSEGVAEQISTKIIPYGKLLAEHKIVTSLMRNLTHVNSIVFNAYLFCMVCEIALIMWLFFDVFLEAHQKDLENLRFFHVGDVELAVPLRFKKKEGERLMKAVVIFGVTMLTYWLFGNVLHEAGAEVNGGSEHVRKHGLVRSRSSKERRFILSMMTSYCPKNPYWLGKRFKFNRIVLTSLLGFIIGASMVTVSFRPTRLELASFEICSQFGTCNEIRVYKTAQHLFYEALDVTPPPPPSTGKPGTSGEEGLKDLPFLKLDPSLRIWKPPCGSHGIYPLKENLITCPANWTFLSEIKMPYHQKLVTISDPASQSLSYDFYEAIIEPFRSSSTTDTNSSETSPCRTETTPKYHFGTPSEADQVLDCFGNKIYNKSSWDDCENPPFSTLDTKLEVQKKEVVRALFVNDIVPNVPIISIVCCFEYEGIENSMEQVKACNLPDASTFLAVCKIGSDRKRMKENPHVFQHQRRIAMRIYYEMKSKGDTNYLQIHQETISNCVCKLDDPQIGLESEEHCQCTGLYLLPCKLFGYIKEINEDDYSLRCGPVRVPLLFKINSDSSLVFHGEHQRYKESCTEPEFRDRFHHSNSLSYPIPCANASPQFQLRLVDCAGSPIELQGTSDIDDCSNWRIKTPDTSYEKMLNSLLILKTYNYDPNSKKIVLKASNHRIFLCCFQYAAQAFQTEAQNKYCNAPNIEAMSTSSWCGGVANNNGKRIPSAEYQGQKFDKLLNDLERTLRHHEKLGNDSWLDSPKINAKWTRCICPDKIVGFDKAKWEQAIIKECQPLVPPDVVEPAPGPPQVGFPLCNHKWPRSTLPHNIGTPEVKIFVDGKWKRPHRFEKLNNPRHTYPCFLDSSYKQRFINDRYPRLFDSAQNPLPLGELDGCLNLPIPTPERVGSSPSAPLVPPKLRLVAEPLMERIQPGTFPRSKYVHCCYYYSGFKGNQHQVCNMPEPAVVKRVCHRITRSDQRKKHELELLKKMIIQYYGAEFMGNRVPPFDLKWDGPEETKWRDCICNIKPSQASNEQCQKLYLPPCVITTDQNYHHLAKIEQMYTKCDADWITHRFKLKIPLLFEFNPKDQTFKRRNIFTDVNGCPNDNNNPDLNQPSEPGNYFTDCYGQEMESRWELDDCGNPRVASPTSKPNDKVDGRDSTEIQLIGVDRIGISGLKHEFLCCWRYRIGDDMQVRHCNMNSKQGMNRRCNLKAESLPQVKEFVEKLKERRRRGEDPLDERTPYDDPIRRGWTNCLCKFDESECRRVAV